MSERLTHSKLAVASTLLPLAIWLYVGMLALLVTRKPFGRFVNWIFDDSLGALGVILYLAIFLFVVIPIAGHSASAICGIIGLFSKDKKRIFSIVGLILNAAPFVAGLIFYESRYGFNF